MMISPMQILGTHLLSDVFWELWSKAKRMDLMREYVTARDWGIEIVVKVVDMHVAVTETPSWSNVEVTNDFVHSKTPFNSASFFSLRIQSLSIVLALALFHVLASPKSPRYTCVCFSDFVASITATLLDCVWRRIRAIASTTVIGVQMGGLVVSGMAAQD
jgi:hypothetical protein